ncbi:MAG: hypothetical protein ACRDEA_14445, partial [Microcystaceae cyanobacterium]
YWSILKYYQQLERPEARRLIVEAASGFWRALAATQGNGVREMGKQRQEVEQGIYQLTQQIGFLQNQFKLGEFVLQGQLINYLEYEAPEPVTFKFRYQAKRDTEQFLLLQYVMDRETQLSPQQKVLWSSVAYWGALADKELAILPPEQLRESAANCICRLRQQIDYLERYFALNSTEWSPFVPRVDAPPEWTNAEEGHQAALPHSREISHEVEGEIKESEQDLLRTQGGSGRETEKHLLNTPRNDELVFSAFKNL